MNQVFIELADSPLGYLRASIYSERPPIALRDDSILTNAHNIQIQQFKLEEKWLPEFISIDGSCCWRFYIEKNSDLNDRLFIELSLDENNSDFESFEDTAEGLAAICINSERHQLHIGTEDIEEHFSRAKTGDWMPRRMVHRLDPHQRDPLILVELGKWGIQVSVPNLHRGEKIYFHLLSAWHEIRPSTEYPAEEDVSSWYAVDRSKNFLDKYLEFPE